MPAVELLGRVRLGPEVDHLSKAAKAVERRERVEIRREVDKPFVGWPFDPARDEVQ